MTAYISRGAPVDALFTTTELLEDDRLFIFTSVLKAHKVVVEAEKSDGGCLAVEVPVIQQMVSSNVGVTLENTPTPGWATRAKSRSASVSRRLTSTMTTAVSG